MDKDGAKESLLTRTWHRVFLPIDPPHEFTESPEELYQNLTTQEGEVAGDVLSYAQDLFDEPFERAESAERRATTFLGALAIAASFGLAGGSLLLDGEKIPEAGWRAALAVAYLALMISLGGAAFRSLETLRVRVWSRPGDESIFDRASRTLVEGRLKYAAELLQITGRNRPVARWKVAQVRAAAWWLTAAIGSLLLVAAVVALYVLFAGRDARPEAPASPTDCAECVHSTWIPDTRSHLPEV